MLSLHSGINNWGLCPYFDDIWVKSIFFCIIQSTQLNLNQRRPPILEPKISSYMRQGFLCNLTVKHGTDNRAAAPIWVLTFEDYSVEVSHRQWASQQEFSPVDNMNSLPRTLRARELFPLKASNLKIADISQSNAMFVYCITTSRLWVLSIKHALHSLRSIGFALTILNLFANKH